MGKKIRWSVNLISLSVIYFLICVCAAKSNTTEVISSSKSQNESSTEASVTTTTTTVTTSAPSSSSSLPVKIRSTTVLPTTKRSVPSTTSSATSTTVKREVVVQAQVIKAEEPQTLPDFIIAMMKKFGPVKAAEAFQSLDTLPLGLIMKILLVEVDKQLAADIVAMQRYAQSTDKSLIQMIGRIVAGDKNVPKEIFTMDDKLMKFPWWMRIRQRMFNNLEKYVAAYSLVPVATKTALNGATSSSGSSSSRSLSKAFSNGLESILEGPKSDLTAAVAASATESYVNGNKQDNSAAASAPVQKLSLQSPLIQQQQILDGLNNNNNNNAQVQQLLQLQQLQQQQQQLLQLQALQQQQQQQQQPQQSSFLNPFLALLG